MKRSHIAFAIAILILLGLAGAGCFWEAGRTPEGQQPLFALAESTFGEFVSTFDAASEGPRLVVLLSPT
jgi:hypothetical protein